MLYRSLLLSFLLIMALQVIQAGDGTSMSEREEMTGTGPVAIVYYFYTTQRCPSCLKIEKFTKETMETEFSSELKDGTIVFKMVNTDKTENEHFIEDFELYTKSVVLVQPEGDKVIRWKNLPRIWQLLNDPPGFSKYIATELAAFMGED